MHIEAHKIGKFQFTGTGSPPIELLAITEERMVDIAFNWWCFIGDVVPLQTINSIQIVKIYRYLLIHHWSWYSLIVWRTVINYWLKDNGPNWKLWLNYQLWIGVFSIFNCSYSLLYYWLSSKIATYLIIKAMIVLHAYICYKHMFASLPPDSVLQHTCLTSS